jgi:hypothetical protein
VIVQLSGYADALDHPDVARIMAVLKARPDLDPRDTRRLESELISGSDVAGLLRPYPGLAAELRSASTLWRELRRWSRLDTPLDAVGEIAFTAPDGYVLLAVESPHVGAR